MEETEPTFSGGYVLSGRLAGVELGTVTLVVNGGVVAGLVWTPEATYRVTPADGGLHHHQSGGPHAVAAAGRSAAPSPCRQVTGGIRRGGGRQRSRRENRRRATRTRRGFPAKRTGMPGALPPRPSQR